MDNLPEFLKQCMKAEEIQRLWKLSDGDFYIYKVSDVAAPIKVNILNDWETRNHIIEQRNSFAWVPRLDQIQSMIDWTKWELCIKKREFLEMHYVSISGEQNSGTVSGASMEKLWLAFVMRENFQKLWYPEKEEWVQT